MMKKKCPQCGEDNGIENCFCIHCGESIEAVEALEEEKNISMPLKEKKIRKKKASMAFFLSLSFPGLGQFYVRHFFLGSLYVLLSLTIAGLLVFWGFQAATQWVQNPDSFYSWSELVFHFIGGFGALSFLSLLSGLQSSRRLLEQPPHRLLALVHDFLSVMVILNFLFFMVFPF